MLPLCLSQRAARTAVRLPKTCHFANAAPRAAIAARALSTSLSRSGPRIPRVNDGNGEAPPAPELGANDNYVNLLEDEDGTISIASVSLPDPTAPPGSEARTSYINLTSGVSTDQPLIILNNTVFLWDPPPLSPTAVLKNTVNARLRSQPRPAGAPPVPILPGGWEAWLDKETGQDEIWKLFEVVTPKPDILLLGTGSRTLPLPQPIRSYLANLGMQIDAQDTRNAASTFNLLKSEGRRVACALLPMVLE